jgi:hypothetical protein
VSFVYEVAIFSAVVVTPENRNPKGLSIICMAKGISGEIDVKGTNALFLVGQKITTGLFCTCF